MLATVDVELGELIGNQLRRHNIDVQTNVDVEGILSSDCWRVVGSNGFEKSADMLKDRQETMTRERKSAGYWIRCWLIPAGGIARVLDPYEFKAGGGFPNAAFVLLAGTLAGRHFSPSALCSSARSYYCLTRH